MKRLMLLTLALCPVLAAQQNCTVEQVRGTYAVFYDGWALFPQPGSPLPLTVPGVIMGVVSVSYHGRLSGTETVTIAGQAMEYEITGGSVELKPDCTGTMQSLARVKGSGADPTPIIERFIALPDKDEIRTTVLNSPDAAVGAMGLGIWKRMSRVPNTAQW